MSLCNILKLLLVIQILICDSSSNLIGATKSSIVKKKDTETKKLDNICNLCSCEDSILNCTNRPINEVFTNYEWPAKLTKALFINSSIENITHFPSIEIIHLIIRKNIIKNIENATFKNINSLEQLDLSDNKLAFKTLSTYEFEGSFSANSELFKPLVNLTVLNLSNNFIEKLDQDLFEHLGGIKKLLLSGNPLRTLDGENIKAFNPFVQLEELDLSNCQLIDLHDDLNLIIKSLKTLNLGNNLFKKPPAVFVSAENLETLIMDSNPIPVLDKKNSFPTMLKLKSLSIDNMPNLTKIDAGSLANLPMLQELSIANCPKLFYISGDTLVNHNNTRAYVPLLKKLDLSNNSLQHFSLEMALWDKIEELYLSNNHWFCDSDNMQFVHIFLPKYGSTLLKYELDTLVCAYPPSLNGRKLVSLEHTELPRLNVYEIAAESANEAAFLVGMLIGLLVAIPVILAIIILWRRGHFVCGTKPASYSRAFYKRTANDIDY